MEKLLEFIQPELFILIPFIFGWGLFLKLYPKFTDEWKIPFILLIMSIVFAMLYLAFIIEGNTLAVILIIGFIQGSLIAAVAVFGNELIKQGFKKRIDDKL